MEENQMAENKEEMKMEDIEVEESAMEEYEVISIPISDGTQREFAILDTFEVEGQDYMAVALVEGEEIQEGIYIYRYENADDGDLIIEQITAPEEYQKVAKFYEEM